MTMISEPLTPALSFGPFGTGVGTAPTATGNAATTPAPGSITGAPSVQIWLLGGFSIVIGGRDVAPQIRRRDALRLAKFLALAPHRRIHREQLIDALWPEASFDSVQNRLHKAAHYLRSAIGLTDSVVLAGDLVALLPHTEVDTDVSAFERLTDRAGHEGDDGAADRAIELYQGDLLPHDPYEEWLDNDRERLRSRLRELLRTSGRFDRLIALDPTDEDGHVGVMRAMLRVGDRSGVLRQYSRLTRVLDDELGVEPDAEARALRDLALTLKAPDSARLLPRLNTAGLRPAGRGRCTGGRPWNGRHPHLTR